MKRISKLLAILAAMTMIFATCTVSFAATSPTAPAAVNVAVAQADAGALNTASIGATASGVALAVNPVSQAFLGDAQAVAATWFAGSFESPKVAKAFDISGTLSGPTDITISVPGLTAGQKVGIVHLTSAGQWESVPVKSVGAGYVVGTFTSLSPVAIVVPGGSPKTGQGHEAAAAAAVLIVSAAAAALCFRRYLSK